MTDIEIKTEISPADEEEDLAQQKSSSSSAENPNHDQQQQEEDETNQFVKPKLPNFPHTAASTTVKREEESAKVEDGDDKSQDVQQQQLLPESGIELRYTEPDWARIPTTSGGQNAYFLEVIKNGSVIEHFSLHSDREKEIAKSYLAIGRFDPCDIKLEHPSVSRFHAVLQYGELVRGRPQWFLFDMNSTHGVRLNKRPIQKSTFVPLTAGHVFQIAGSSRLFILSGGPDEEMDVDESEGSKQPTTKIEMSADEAEKDGKSGDDKNTKKEAASAADGEELKDGEGGEEERQAFYVKDPLYWLERYFEREGSQMNFKFTKTVGEGVDLFGGLGLEEGGSKKKRARGGGGGDDGSNWICSIELVSDVSLSRGTMVTASAPSRRLAQQQCALLACERLDEACLLQISSLWNKRKTYAENDFYEEDEDVFFDRTGQLEEQREKRKRRYEGDPADSNRAKTYDDLLKDLADVDTKLGVIGSEIQRLMGSNKYAEQQQQQAGDGAAENKPAMNFSMRMAISQMKSKEKKLLEEKHRLTRLAAIAKPSRPQFIPKSSAIKKEKVEEKRRPMPLGPAMKEETEHGKEEEKGMEEKGMEDDEENPAIEEEGSQKKKEDSTKSEETVKKVLDKYLPTNASATAPPKNAASAMAERGTQQQRRMAEEKASQQKPASNGKSEAIPSPAEDEQLGKDEAETEERFYAPAMPSRAQAQAIAPKFGMLTKEEMVQMKLWQRQRDEETEEARRAKLHQQERAQQMQEEEPAFDVTEKYATWLPPDDQSGDGSTRLNKKFAGKY